MLVAQASVCNSSGDVSSSWAKLVRILTFLLEPERPLLDSFFNPYYVCILLEKIM